MQPEVKVEQVQLDTLKPYSGNAKKHTNEQIDAVEQSIKQFGFRNPILAWHNEAGEAEIVAGHGRAIAAKKLGIKEVPVVFVDDLTDAQRRMLTHADNQTTMMTGWDLDQLAYELDVLSADFDVSDFGFDMDKPLDVLPNESEEAALVTQSLQAFHDYVVLQFNNEMDFYNTCDQLGVEMNTQAGRTGYKGISRVCDGVRALDNYYKNRANV